MFEAFKKYAVFQGRAARSEYWLYNLVVGILSIVAMAADVTLGMADEETGLGPLSFIVLLAVIIPGLAVSIRRCHDLDKPGWLLLLAFVPYVGIGLFVYFAIPGTAGSNRYGEDPLDQQPLAQE